MKPKSGQSKEQKKEKKNIEMSSLRVSDCFPNPIYD